MVVLPKLDVPLSRVMFPEPMCAVPVETESKDKKDGQRRRPTLCIAATWLCEPSGNDLSQQRKSARQNPTEAGWLGRAWA